MKTLTDYPLISILMAIYEPQMDWLREQLLSLNAQTYPNLRLYIREDASPTVAFVEIQRCVQECVTNFPYILKKNSRNMGSNRTFEELTREAEGEYCAYCDQDDVWLPEKLTVLRREMEESGALLVCSDMYIMDGQGRQTADSMTKIRRHHRLHSGTGLAEGLMVCNFVTGCTMLVRTEAAKEAIPFCPYMVHDHYIALWCAGRGSIQSIPRPLIHYRVHGNNQTSFLKGVTDKRSYGQIRIAQIQKRMRWLKDHLNWGGELSKSVETGLAWADARADNWSHWGGVGTLWRYRRFSLPVSLFELVMARMPEPVFQIGLFLGKRNLL